MELLIFTFKIVFYVIIFWAACGLVATCIAWYDFSFNSKRLITIKDKSYLWLNLEDNLWLIPLGLLGLITVVLVLIEDYRKGKND